MLDCEVDESTIHCTGVSGVIDKSEVFCVYDSGPRLEKCELHIYITKYYVHNIKFITIATISINFFSISTGELPVTIDFTRYDRNPGMHNITIIANSTRREMADYTYSFPVQGALH